MPQPPDLDGLEHLLRWVQDGVVSRRQLLALHLTHGDLERMVRRKELVRIVPGVYVDHTGPLSLAQREWVAVLAHWPAALTGLSALPSPPHRAVVDVAIADTRTVKAVAGVRAHRTAGLDHRVDWRCSPPRMRLEHAVIDVASARRDDVWEVYRLLADVVQTRRTTAGQVGKALRTRRVAGQAMIAEVLEDLATGACSVLEREYLRRVERAHGLPPGRRQAPGVCEGRPTERDVVYEIFGLLVELDGRAFHDSVSDRDRDARRDLEARVKEDLVTVRLTWGLVLATPCRTASRVTRLLRRGGWTGQFARCPSCPDDLDL